jgi:predicted metal-dependent peptidase
VHAELFGVDANVPLRHETHLRSVEESEYLPGSQSTHLDSASFSCSPSLHEKHVVLVMSDICFVSGHGMQLVKPDTGVYSLRNPFRSPQNRQLDNAGKGPYLPGAQFIHTEAAAAEYVPAEHVVQTVEIVAAVEVEYRPARQPMQNVCPRDV